MYKRQQLGGALGGVEANRIKRQIEVIERKMAEVERDLSALESAPAAAAEPPPAYDPAAVRDLLLQAFTAADFKRLFLYASDPGLRQLVREFGDGDGLTKMVATAIELCTTRELMPALLDEVKKANPRMYGMHEARLLG